MFRAIRQLLMLALATCLLVLVNAVKDYNYKPRPQVVATSVQTEPIRRVAKGDLVAVFRVAGARYGIPWQLLFAQCWKESNFVLNARGAAGEKGMAQFMPATWLTFGRGDPDNPRNAAEGQARYLAHIARYLSARGITDPRMVIAGYNCGEGCAAAAGRFESLSPGVQRYTADVWRRYEYLKAIWR